MQSWFQSLTGTTKGRKSNKKNRRQEPHWRSRFEALQFQVERLEDRTLLAVDIGIAPITTPAPFVTTGAETYTYLVTNNDTAAATTGATFTDTFTAPAGTTATVSDSAGDISAAPIALTSGVAVPFVTQIPASGTDTITVTLTTTASGALVNTASVSETGDSNPANNTAGPTASAVSGTAAPSIDLAVTKSASPATAAVGTPEIYTITVTNDSTNNASGVTLVDTLPANTTFNSTSGGSVTNGVLTDTIGALNAGQSATVTVTVTPTAAASGGTLSNTAAVAGDQADPTPTNNTKTISTPVATAANVSVHKTVPGTGTVGTAVTDTVTLDNAGAGAVSNVAFTDAITLTGAAITAVSASDAAGDTFTYNAGTTTLSGTIASLASGTTTVTIVYIPTAAGTVADTASVNIPVGNTGTPATATGSTTVATGVTPANVSVAKTAPANGTVGTPVTDTVTLTNAGGSAVSNVAFSDVITLSGGATIGTVSGSDGGTDTFTYNSGTHTLSGTIASVSNATPTTVTIIYTPTAGGTVADTASVSITGGNSGTPAATQSTTVSIPDVSVAKTAPANGTVGTPVTDTVTVTNAGTAAVSNVAFSDVIALSGGATITTVSGSDGGDTFTYNSGTHTLTGTISSVSNITPTTVTITYTPTAAGTVADTASVNITGNTGTPISANGSTTITVAPDVSVAKTAPANGTTGTPVTDTVTLTNAGTAAVSNVAFSDVITLSGGATIGTVSGSDAAGDTFTYNSGTHTLTGTISSVSNTTPTTVTITYTPTAAGTVADTASVNITGNTGTPTSASGSTTVTVAPDVTVAKTAPPNGTVGTPVTDTVTLTNAGTAAVSNVAFSDVITLSGGATITTVSGSDGVPTDTFTYNSGTHTLTGTIGSLAVGASAVTITYTPTAAGTVADTASVTITGNTGTPTSANGSTTVAAAPDVTVGKTAPANGSIGAAVTDTVTLTNVGSAAVANVAFSDVITLSGGATITAVSGSDAAGDTFTYNSGTHTLSGTITSLASGATPVSIVYTPTTAGTVADTASVNITGNTGTPTSANGSTTVAAAASPADVNVAKVAPATGTVGAAVTDTVTLTNAGTSAVSNVALTDAIANTNVAGVSASDAAHDTFTYNSGNNSLTGTIASLATGATTVTIVYTPTAAGTFGDTASISIPVGNSGTSSSNGSTAVTAGVTPADVNVTKAGPANGTPGTPVTDTITLNNAGATAVTNVAFTDALANSHVSNVTGSDAAHDTFTFNNGNLTGTIANVPTGATTVTVVYTPTAAGTFTDTASISIAAGNSGTSFGSATTTVAAPPADVSVAKSAPANGSVGTAVTDTVTLTNGGTSAVTNVAFSDAITLSGGATVSGVAGSDAAGDTFTYNSGTNTLSGTVANLATGATTVTIVYTPTAAGTVADTASVNITGNTGTPTSANGSTTIAAAAAPKVSVAKSAPASGTVGTAVTDTVTLTNGGTAAVTNVAFSDAITLSGGATISSVSGSDAAHDTFTYNSSTNTLSGTIANLATGATTVTIVYTPTATGTVADTASVTVTGNTGTPTSATGSTTIATATPSLSIVKSGPATDQPGGSITYTITVSNSGGAAATGASITDTLQAGLTLVSATDSAGTVTHSGNTVTDALGSVAANGGTETLTIVATPASSLNGTSVTDSATLTFNSTQTTSNTVSTKIGTVTVTTGVGFLAGVPGDGTVQTFVTNLYRELLGREPDSAGSAFWVAYLNDHDNAAGRQQEVQAFMNSPEYAIHYVTTAYQVILGRAPDAPGLQFWTGKMGQPGTPGQNTGSADEKFIIAALYGSDEFYLKSGNTPQGWVNALYQDILGRPADGDGMNFWTNELKVRGASDRDGIVRDLLTAPEVAHLLLDTYYPTAGGTASTPLAAPGSTAGTGRTELSLLTGGGWENLYLEGPYDSAQEGNDAFFGSLAGGGNWDDIQLLILETNQFYNNPNRPLTTGGTASTLQS